jgi:hypothetical protein
MIFAFRRPSHFPQYSICQNAPANTRLAQAEVAGNDSRIDFHSPPSRMFSEIAAHLLVACYPELAEITPWHAQSRQIISGSSPAASDESFRKGDVAACFHHVHLHDPLRTAAFLLCGSSLD